MKDQQARKQNIIAALKSLQNHNGWKIIAKVLKANIQDAQNQLEGNDPTVKIENIADMKRIQDKITDRKYLLNMPNELIGEYAEATEFPQELDPFE